MFSKLKKNFQMKESDITMASNDCGIDINLFRNKVVEMFFCNLCHMVLNDAVELKGCRHLFCNSCLQRYQKVAAKGKQELLCPVDRQVVAFNQVLPSEDARKYIDNLEVFCPNKPRGCGWEGSYKGIESHLAECEHKDRFEEVLDKMGKMTERMTKMDEKMVEREREHNFLKNNHEIVLSHNLNLKLRKQKDDIGQVRLENEEVKVKINDLEIKTEDETSALKKENEEMKKQNDEMKVEMGSLRKENEEMKVEMGSIRKENDEMKKQNEELKVKVTNLRKELAPICRQIYFEFSIDNNPIGRIVINLFPKAAPKTCHKVREMCTSTDDQLSYKGEKLDRLSDVCFGFGHELYDNAVKSGHPADTFKTEKENLSALHDKKGVVTLLSHPKCVKSTGSRILILNQAYPGANGNHVIFGQVTDESMKVAEKIWGAPRDGSCKPSKVIKIEDCGVIV